MKHCVAMLLLSVSLLSGCASSGRLSAGEQLAAHQAAAGEPVPSFRFVGHLVGWTEIDDTHLAVQSRPSQSWLLTLAHGCPGLEWAQGIGLTSRFDRVYANADKVLVPGNGRVGCRIARIQPLDTAALKGQLRQLRQARIEERQDEPAG